MSDRPTPQTDAYIASQSYSPTEHQWRCFARKLERELNSKVEELNKCMIRLFTERNQAREIARIAFHIIRGVDPKFVKMAFEKSVHDWCVRHDMHCCRDGNCGARLCIWCGDVGDEALDEITKEEAQDDF